MDLLAIDAWARRAESITGATVRKVALRDEGLFEVTLSGPGSPGFLCWTFSPPDPMVCLLAERLLAGEKGGEVDPGLRRTLEGGVISGVLSCYPERRLEILLRPAIPKITPGPLRLVLELRQPGGGLLLDGEEKVRWRHGEVPAVTVSAPPAPESLPVERIAVPLAGKVPAEAARALPREVFGIPPWLVRGALSGLPPDVPLDPVGAARAAGRILALLSDYRGGKGGWEAVAITPTDPDSAWKVVGNPEGGRDVNAALAAALTAGRGAASRGVVRRSTTRVLRRLAEKTERTIEAVNREIPSREEIDLWRRRGELLLAYLRQVPSGVDSVELPSFDDPSEKVLIPLDPSAAPQVNAAACFSRARKGETAMREKARRREDLTRRLALLRALLDAASRTTDLGELRDLAGKVERPATGRREAKTDQGPKLPVRVFPQPGGETVLVGKNAAGNELIYRHLSRGDDLWFHARDWPGSHALVRAAGPAGASEGALALGAALAAWFSKGRGAGKVEVVATFRRNLRKPPGSAPGTVTLRGERSTVVNLEDPEVRSMLHDAGVDDA